MTEIEIPDSVNKVENYAFAGCKSLKTVSYPSGLDVSNASIPTVTTQAEYVKAEDGSVTITKIIPAENGTITLPEAIGGVKPAISQEAKDALKSVEHTHGGGKATCSAKAVCDFCNTGYGETKAHTEEVIPEKPATCTETGLTAGKRCSVCSTVITAPTTIPAKGHSLDSGTVTKEASCTEKGEKTYSCANCDYTKTEEIAALGHSFTRFVSNNDASCTEDGTETAVCDRCTETKTRTAVGSKTGHTASDWQNDSDSHWHECECGEKTDTAAHTEDSGTVTKQPTSTETGIKTFKCTVCGYVMNTEIIPSAGTPSTPVTPPSVPSIPSTATSAAAAQTPSKEPFIQGDNGKTGWEAISDTILGTPDGGTVTVNMNSTTKLPKKIVSQIKGRDIDLVLEMGGGFVWTINGMSVTKAKTVDMGVRKAIKIPKSTVQEFFGASKAVQLDLRHNGDFGFTAVLTVDIGNKYSGMYANSYCYKTRKFEFGDSAEIADGQARLKFTHASSWLITVEDSPVIEDVSSAAGIYEKSENSEDSKMPAVISGTSIIAALGIFYLKTRGKTR